MTLSPCPGCPDGRRAHGKYLCYDCWHELPLATRRALSRTDRFCVQRLQELYDQLTRKVPLSEIHVRP